MASHNIVVIGASAGGVEALTKLVRTLPKDLPVALFVVLHIPADSPSLLPQILSRAGALQASHPTDRAAIASGKIYVAPPDHHLIVERGYVRVVRGPKENRHRPAIDPLFRSAASAYRQHVVGVVLSGGLDDGTAGLLAIKRCGGVSVVQSPKEALYPQMAQSALDNVQIDYCLPVEKISELLTRLAYEDIEEEPLATEEAGQATPLQAAKTSAHRLSARACLGRHESVEMQESSANPDELVGKASTYSCPECAGVLMEIQDGKLLRFRCRIGHAFSAESVIAEQSEVLDRALWIALKTLEEKVDLLQRLANQTRGQAREWLAHDFEGRMAKAERHANLLQQILTEAELESSTAEASSAGNTVP